MKKNNLLKAVKQAILQEAVQGKLTEEWRKQNPNIEPASELLKRIKAEKEKLIKEKKIRKEKPLPPITEDEIPFALPKSWVWCRLGEIIELIMGQSPAGHTYNKVGKGLPFFQGKKEFGEIYPTGNSTWCSAPKRISKVNDILISVRAPVGDVNLSDKEYAIGRGLSIIRVFSTKNLYYWFLFYLLRAEQNNWKGKGSFFSAINRSVIENKIIPLPPLAEQKAIVQKVEKLMQQADAISQGANIDDFEVVDKKAYLLLKNYSIIKNILDEIIKQKEYVKELKQSILQEAVRGKLTQEWRTKNSPPMEGWQTQSDGVVAKRNTINYMKLPYNPKLKQKAKELRKAGNLSEVLFWNQVKKRQFLGLDFDRQKIIGNYIVDFYCANNNVVIEIDGNSHNDKQEYDKQRDEFLESLGLIVIHIKDIDVKRNINGVFEYLKNHNAFKNKKKVLNSNVTTPPLRGTPPEEGNEGNDGRNWESASELLKRIKAEKEKLIKKKKIRKEKLLPPITEEEIPFELPESWLWCRITELFRVLSTNGKQVKNKDYLDKGNFPIVDQGKKLIGGYSNDKSKLIEIENPIIIFGDHTKEIKFIDFNFIPGADGTKLLDFYEPQYVKFIYYLLKAIKLENRGYSRHFKVLKNKIIPLPPLAEQKAIVQKVEKLMQKVSQMEEEIKKSEQNAQMLMQAVLKELFENKSV
jgi:type I restriction enzyme S subunit